MLIEQQPEDKETDVTEETCSLCDGARYNRGWCRRHYNRWWRWGDPEYVHQRPTLDERFWAKVNKTEGCWLWTGYSTSGYGYLRWGPQENQQFEGAHRYAYTKLRGPIPEGLVLDHLCRTPLCVNPDHLEVVTNAVNVLRGMSPPARNARKTHCKRGHEFTAENTRWSSRGHRSCKSCDRDPAGTAPVTLDLCVAVADDGQVYVPAEAVVALLRAMATAARICADEMDGDLAGEVLDMHADGLEVRAIEAVSEMG